MKSSSGFQNPPAKPLAFHASCTTCTILSPTQRAYTLGNPSRCRYPPKNYTLYSFTNDLTATGTSPISFPCLLFTLCHSKSSRVKNFSPSLWESLSFSLPEHPIPFRNSFSILDSNHSEWKYVYAISKPTKPKTVQPDGCSNTGAPVPNLIVSSAIPSE